MKTKILLMISLLNWAFMVSADNKSTSKSEQIEITVDTDGDKITKKIIVNGKELSPEEIEEFEASGKMKSIHMSHDDMSKSVHEVIVIKDSDSVDDNLNKKVKVIKKHLDNGDDEEIEIQINKDGDKTTEKITVNGKELTEEEIEEFKTSGKMKVLHLDSDSVDRKGHKMMFINTNSDQGEDIDIDVIMEKIEGIDDSAMEDSIIQEWISEDGKNIKVIKKGFVMADDKGASLGFIANVEDDGWHLTKIMDKSGAKDVGILEGDIVTSIAGMNLTRNPNSERLEVHSLPKFEENEMVKVKLERDGKKITFDVQARKLDKSEMLIELESNSNDHFKWLENYKDKGDGTSNIKVMVFNGKDGDFRLNEEDIHMVFPDKLDKMNFFISDGKSTSKLLGKNHEMSSMSEGLSKYFNTQGGVLVLHVDDSNAFDLQDGDVIKSINGHQVDSPKDVVKQLIKVDEQENIQMKVIRNKKSKTLKYEK